MRIAIIGHIPVDYYTLADGSRHTGLGGIFYGAAALAELVGPHGSVTFISRVGEAVLPNVKHHAAQLGVELHADTVPGDGWSVQAVYFSGEMRRERLLGHVPPWTAGELLPLVSHCDGVLLNMVTGYEIRLPEFKELAASVDSLMLDFHSLALGRDATGLRYPVVNADAPQWCAMATMVQMNRTELASVLPGVDPLRGAETIASWGSPWAAVTDGSGGVYLGQKGEACHLPAHHPTATPVDPTGCGDVFGAALLVRFIKGEKLREAARKAQILARKNADFKGLPGSGAFAGLV